jgi:hypothetical protein
LSWLVDIAQLLRQTPRLDWDDVEKQARVWRCRRALWLGLLLSSELLEAAVPQHILHRSSSVWDLARNVCKNFLSEHYGNAGPFQRITYAWHSQDSFGDRAGHVWGQVLTPSLADWEGTKIPPAFAVLYYPLRLARLCCRESKGLAKRIFAASRGNVP